MRKVLYAMILCLSIQSLMAEESKPTVSSKKLFIGMNFSPGVAFTTYVQTQHSAELDQAYHFFKSGMRPIFGYDLGMNINYTPHQNVGIETGVNFSQKGYKESLTPGPIPPTAPSDSIQHSTNIYPTYFIDVPIKLKTYAGKGMVKFVAGAGLVLDFLFGYTNKFTLTQNGRTLFSGTHTYLPATKGYNLFQISASASAGIDYRINDKMGLRVEPIFTHQFLQFHEGSFKDYFWTAGVNVAYYFGVK